MFYLKSFANRVARLDGRLIIDTVSGITKGERKRKADKGKADANVEAISKDEKSRGKQKEKEKEKNEDEQSDSVCVHMLVTIDVYDCCVYITLPYISPNSLPQRKGKTLQKHLKVFILCS